MNTVTNFKEWVVEEYQRRGWSMRELARRSGYSAAGISKVLSTDIDPTWDFCAAIARGFDMTPTDVFRRAGLMPPQSETANIVGDIVSQLNERDQQVALRIVRALAGQPHHRILRLVADTQGVNYSAKQTDTIEIDELSLQIVHRLADLPPDRRAEIHAMINQAHEGSRTDGPQGDTPQASSA